VIVNEEEKMYLKIVIQIEEKHAAKWSQTSYLVTTQSFGHNLNPKSNQKIILQVNVKCKLWLFQFNGNFTHLELTG
jgi:hypothetical protein